MLAILELGSGEVTLLSQTSLFPMEPFKLNSFSMFIFLTPLNHMHAKTATSLTMLAQ